MDFVTGVGFNFRQTNSGNFQDIDDANQIYVLPADTYPTTRSSITFGWQSTPGGNADYDYAIDPRFAGTHAIQNTGSNNVYFQVDLAVATDHDFRVALGNTAADTANNWVMDDNGTNFGTEYWDQLASTNEYYDATAVKRTEAAWPGSNAAISRTMGSTQYRIYLSRNRSSGWTNIAHLHILQTGGGGGSIIPIIYQQIHKRRVL
jgi:hypothetical protein